LPITYTWQATDHEPKVHTTDTLSHTVSYTWQTPGTKTITVTAYNGYGEPVTATHTMVVSPEPSSPEPHALTSATIQGPPEGDSDTSYDFTVEVQPANATTPITYTWQATDHEPEMHVDGLSNTVSYAWNTIGTKTITVTADNGYGNAVLQNHAIAITKPENNNDPAQSVYLPLITR
jgi:hypothetical protein